MNTSPKETPAEAVARKDRGINSALQRLRAALPPLRMLADRQENREARVLARELGDEVAVTIGVLLETRK